MSPEQADVIVRAAFEVARHLERWCVRCGEFFYADERLVEKAKARGRDVRVCDACVLDSIEKMGRVAERRDRRHARMTRKRRRGWA